MRSPSVSLQPWRTAALLSGGALLSFFLVVAADRGDTRLARGVVGAAAAVVMAIRPREAFLLLLVLGASVLRYGSLGLTVAGHVTDVVELMIFGLIGIWVLAWGMKQVRVESAFTPFVCVLVVAVLFGAVVGSDRGSSGHDLFGYIKPWMYYVLAIPMASWFATEAHRQQLHRWIVRICVVGGLLTILVVTSGISLPLVGTRPLDVGTLGVTELGVVRVRPDLVALLVLATLLVAGEIAVEGITPLRVAVLGLFLFLHVLTFTRSTWVPLGLCLVLLALFHPGPRRPLRLLKRGLVVTVLGALLFGGAYAGAFGETGIAAARRLESVTQPRVFQEPSYTDRESENAAAWRALGRHPLTGVGLAQLYGARRLVYLPDPPRLVWIDRSFIHNQYLYAWLQLGLLGPIALAVLAVTALRCGLRSRRLSASVAAMRGMAASLALLCFMLQFFLQTTILYPANILAVICAMTLASPRVREDDAVTDANSPVAAAAVAQVGREPLRRASLRPRRT